MSIGDKIKRINKASTVLDCVKNEYLSAKDKHDRHFSSPHEGYAVMLEEVDELWEEVKRKEFDKEAARKEAVQIGSMVIRFIIELC